MKLNKHDKRRRQSKDEKKGKDSPVAVAEVKRGCGCP